MEGKRGRGRPAKTWFQDLKDWTKLDMADASQPATDRERWREIIRITAAQIVAPGYRVHLFNATYLIFVGRVEWNLADFGVFGAVLSDVPDRQLDTLEQSRL